MRCNMGVVGCDIRSMHTSCCVVYVSGTALERAALESDSLVRENVKQYNFHTPEYRRARGILRESAPTMG